MSSPNELSAFEQALPASEEVRGLVWNEYGKTKAPKRWEAFQEGENPDDFYALLEERIGELGQNRVDVIKAAAPDHDTFEIEIWKVGPVYLIKANEFGEIGYFGTKDEAYDHAWENFSGYIEALAERRRELGLDDEDGEDFQ